MPIRKIAIVEPKSSHVNVYSKVPIPRVGSVLLGTILRNLSYEVNVYVEDVAPIDWSEVLTSDLVGVSTLTSTFPRSAQVARLARAWGIPVVIGGTHVSFLPDEGLDCADYVVRGEGEVSFPRLLKAIDAGSGFEDILGISYWKDGQKVHNPDQPFLDDLDVNPIPDFGLVRGPKRHPVITQVTLRGCPFDCSFCSVTTFNGKRPRSHSVERVLDELEYQVKHHHPWYNFFGDDIFNVNPGRMQQILEGMLSRGVTVHWGAQVRHEVTRREDLIKLMARASCERVFVGFESINPDTLIAYDKRETVEDIKRSIEVFHRHGISVHGMFVVGSDFDSAATVRETASFAMRHDIDSIQIMILTPLPGARDYDNYVRDQRRFLTDDLGLYDGHHAILIPKKISPYQLQTETMKAMRRFYSLRRVARNVAQGNFRNAALKYEGGLLIKEWFRDPINQRHIEFLKNYDAPLPVRQEAELTPVRKIAIDLRGEYAHVRESLEVFFKELGVKVVKIRKEMSDRLAEEQVQVRQGGAAFLKQVLSYLEGLKGKVDCVILPINQKIADYESRLARKIESVHGSTTDLPRVIHFPTPEDREAMSARLKEIGGMFTDDEAKIERAYKKAVGME